LKLILLQAINECKHIVLHHLQCIVNLTISHNLKQGPSQDFAKREGLRLENLCDVILMT